MYIMVFATSILNIHLPSQCMSTEVSLFLNLKRGIQTLYSSSLQSFWNFAQHTAESLLCAVQNFKMILQLKVMLWTNEILLDLSLTDVSAWCPICMYITIEQPTGLYRLKHQISQSWSLPKWSQLMTLAVELVQGDTYGADSSGQI